jgi:hypothetical protein
LEDCSGKEKKENFTEEPEGLAKIFETKTGWTTAYCKVVVLTKDEAAGTLIKFDRGSEITRVVANR